MRKRGANKPWRTPEGPKKFAVYGKNPDDEPKLVRFGDPEMEIKRDDPERRKSFRARHKCDSDPPTDKTKARYWSCWTWRKGAPVSKIVSSMDDLKSIDQLLESLRDLCEN